MKSHISEISKENGYNRKTLQAEIWLPGYQEDVRSCVDPED